MFKRGARTSPEYGEGRDRLTRSEKLQLAAGAAATVVVGSLFGFQLGHESTEGAQFASNVEAEAANDNFVRTEFVGGNTDSDYPIINIMIEDCSLPATVTLTRDEAGRVVDISNYHVHADSNTDQYDTGIAGMAYETESIDAQKYSDVIFAYGQNPCETVHDPFKPYSG